LGLSEEEAVRDQSIGQVEKSSIAQPAIIGAAFFILTAQESQACDNESNYAEKRFLFRVARL
jgi:hypothetical protein